MVEEGQFGIEGAGLLWPTTILDRKRYRISVQGKDVSAAAQEHQSGHCRIGAGRAA
ncbi:MAG: hypothetical protein ACRDHX_06640 [Chloroflexota bacterium]